MASPNAMVIGSTVLEARPTVPGVAAGFVSGLSMAPFFVTSPGPNSRWDF